MPRYKGLVSEKKIPSTSPCAQKAQSTQTPQLKAVNARAARTSSQGELYWVSSDWGDTRQHVTVKKVCSAAGIRTVSSLMSPQYWSSIEFVHKELACTPLNLLWTGIFRCYQMQASLYTLHIVESSTQVGSSCHLHHCQDNFIEFNYLSSEVEALEVNYLLFGNKAQKASRTVLKWKRMS